MPDLQRLARFTEYSTDIHRLLKRHEQVTTQIIATIEVNNWPGSSVKSGFILDTRKQIQLIIFQIRDAVEDMKEAYLSPSCTYKTHTIKQHINILILKIRSLLNECRYSVKVAWRMGRWQREIDLNISNIELFIQEYQQIYSALDKITVSNVSKYAAFQDRSINRTEKKKYFSYKIQVDGKIKRELLYRQKEPPEKKYQNVPPEKKYQKVSPGKKYQTNIDIKYLESTRNIGKVKTFTRTAYSSTNYIYLEKMQMKVKKKFGLVEGRYYMLYKNKIVTKSMDKNKLTDGDEISIIMKCGCCEAKNEMND